MIIFEEYYVIIDSSFPLTFYNSGMPRENVQDAKFFKTEEAAKEELATYDDEDECKIIKVTVSYSF